MAENRTGLYRLLAHPFVYELVQLAFGGRREREKFVRRHLQLQGGEKVLDIGCGTAEIVNYLPQVSYIGFEPNPSYVDHARAHFPGEFHAKYFEASDAEKIKDVDLVIITAVLHHLDDDEAQHLFSLLRGCLKATGRVVTIDPVFIDRQNPVARFFISKDRGQNVRTSEKYRDLATESFSIVEGIVQHKQMPPYTHWIMTASKPKP